MLPGATRIVIRYPDFNPQLRNQCGSDSLFKSIAADERKTNLKASIGGHVKASIGGHVKASIGGHFMCARVSFHATFEGRRGTEHRRMSQPGKRLFTNR
jgi:hypothetical protein